MDVVSDVLRAVRLSGVVGLRSAITRGIATVALALTLTASACRPTERFVAADADVVRDTTTELDWTRRDHDEALPWDAADRWCRDLALGGRDDWRLPDIGELQTLYDASRDEPCGDRRCRIDPVIRMRGPYVWSATARGVGTRFYFDMGYANALSPTVTPELVRRVLCVRGNASGVASMREPGA